MAALRGMVSLYQQEPVATLAQTEILTTYFSKHVNKRLFRFDDVVGLMQVQTSHVQNSRANSANPEDFQTSFIRDMMFERARSDGQLYYENNRLWLPVKETLEYIQNHLFSGPSRSDQVPFRPRCKWTDPLDSGLDPLAFGNCKFADSLDSGPCRRGFGDPLDLPNTHANVEDDNEWKMERTWLNMSRTLTSGSVEQSNTNLCEMTPQELSTFRASRARRIVPYISTAAAKQSRQVENEHPAVRRTNEHSAVFTNAIPSVWSDSHVREQLLRHVHRPSDRPSASSAHSARSDSRPTRPFLRAKRIL
jgi:hypothetical protein